MQSLSVTPPASVQSSDDIDAIVVDRQVGMMIPLVRDKGDDD
jgi:hypothetical protein